MVTNSNPNKTTHHRVFEEWHVAPPAMNNNNNNNDGGRWKRETQRQKVWFIV